MPKVSVIIPVYNVENYLRQCLDSVINQTLKDIEIILVDDGSTDSSLSICNEYISGRDITTDLKACKNKAEMEGMRKAHLLDGAAYVNFLSSIDGNRKYTEKEIAERLEEERRKMPGYIEPSFHPISAWKEHGAVVH